MTQAPIAPPGIDRDSTAVQIAYRIGMSQPQTHLFEVELRVSNWPNDRLDLKMPVWTPGSYLVREYARHVRDFQAQSLDRRALTVRKIAKNHWQIDRGQSNEIIISYRVFANELTVRTNHLDLTHGYFNPAALCYYIPGWENRPISIQIVTPNPDWKIATALPETAPQTFLSPDFDTLVDSPFEIGIHQAYSFTIDRKNHQLVVWGDGNFNADRTVADIEKIVRVESQIFDGLPYENYLFILHLFNGGGGLEHKHSCSLIYPRFNFKSRDKYNRFIQLVAHEFFHLWNVKRIRPIALESFDYDGENYTPSLWFSEGTTSYYDLVIPRRAEIYDGREFLNELSKEITRFLTTPGRAVQPLSESSFDAWIKLYRPDANSINSQMSYYLKGEMVTLLLDLLIRTKSQGTRSFDLVLAQMWEEFGQAEIGFTEERLKQIIETVADTDLTAFYDRYIHGLDELPFNEYLAPFGLILEPITEGKAPHTGMTLEAKNGLATVKSVLANSPAYLVGIDPGDEILAIEGFKIKADQINDRLLDYQPGDDIELTLFHHDRLIGVTITLSPPTPDRYQLKFIDNPTPTQQQLVKGWIGELSK
jgi:predicted metalloprotease with PDZ domain